MRIYITGATGFIGSYLVPELINAGHRVTGLTRSDAGADLLTNNGAKVLHGDVNDPGILHTAAAETDAIIHAAINHDFANLKQYSE